MPVKGAKELTAAWQVTGAAAVGVSHRRAGLPCQDALAWRVLPDGTLIAALADGAGSARFSDQGAARAVETALDALEAGAALAGDWETLLQAAFDAARQSVLDLAAGDENATAPVEAPDDAPAGHAARTPRDFACTLTCVVAAPGALAVGQVGDGALVASAAGEPLVTLTRLQRGEYANETHFLVEEDALDQLVIASLDRPVDRLALMSDGLIRLALKMPTQEPHEPFFAPLFRFAGAATDPAESAAQLVQFLDSERVCDRTDDDKSLLLAVRRPTHGEEAGEVE
jgi:hypothetical protein